MGPDGCLAGPRGLARALPEQYDLLAVTSCLGIHQLASQAEPDACGWGGVWGCLALQSRLPAMGCPSYPFCL